MTVILLAFLRRDTLSHVSYRLQFALDLLSIVFSVATVFFVSRLLGGAAAPALAGYGGDYFAFAVIGIAFSNYQSFGVHSFANSIREEQFIGTLEPVLSSPVPIPAFLLASSLWDFLHATLLVGVHLLFAALLFGMGLSRADWPAAAVVLAATLAAFMSLGTVSAAFILRFKRGDPVTWFFSSVSGLLAGVWFPVSVLPDWMQSAARVVPMTHALEGLRLTLLNGAGLHRVAPHVLVLAGFTAVLGPLGAWMFRRQLDAARKDGSLGHY